MRYTLLLVVLMIVVSCKPDSATKSTTAQSDANETAELHDGNKTNAAIKSQDRRSTMTTKDGKGNPTGEQKTNFNREGVPDACDLLTAETISKYVGQPADIIFLADGSSPQSPTARACFFKWDGSAIANAGVMVQVQKNPVEEEVPDYFTYLISSRKTGGETDPATGAVVKFKDWPGFGDDGAYSTEAGKYIWRIGNEWAFMVAFNTVLPPKSQKKAAEAFAKEVMSRMPNN